MKSFLKSIKITAVLLIVVLTHSCKKTPLETGTVTDIDGNVYKTVKIGNQWWMSENLRTTHYKDGTAIPGITEPAGWVLAGSDTAAANTGAYCWYGNDSVTYGIPYAALYNWYAASSGKLAPSGWHVPTDADWSALTHARGGDECGGTLKDGTVVYWKTPDVSATNETGFSALGGGYRDAVHGLYNEVKLSAFFWTSSDSVASRGWSRKLVYTDYLVHRQTIAKGAGLSIRCIKD